MKKAISVITILVMVLSMLSGAVSVCAEDVAEDEPILIALLIDYPYAMLNDSTRGLIDPDNENVMPIIVDDRTLVPLRFISEQFGADVAWEDDTRSITLTLRDTEVTMAIDSNEFYINGELNEMDVPAQIIEERTMIPLRAMAESLGKLVYWDPPTNLIIVYDYDGYIYTEEGMEAEDISYAWIVKGFITYDGPSAAPDVFESAAPSSSPEPSESPEPAVITVTASKYEIADHGTYLPENTLDGDMSDGSSWRAEYEDESKGEWIMFDLGEVRDVDSIDIAFFKGAERKYKFDILVSADGKEFTAVSEGITNSGIVDGMETYEIGEEGIRFIKIIGYGNDSAGAPKWTNIIEVAID